LAIGIGLVTVVVNAGAFSEITGNPLNLAEEWSVFLFQILLAAAPFGLLAYFGVRDRSAWVLGIGLTAILWGYYLYDGIRYQLSGDTSGVNMGLAFLLMASPIFISIACFALAAWKRRRSN
jgi:hypothetical protein